MVFIEVKSKYIENLILSTPGLSNFINYLFGERERYKEDVSDDTNDSNKLISRVDHLIRTLINNDLDQFSAFCDEYQSRVPDENSPWINNNYLIYLVIVGSFVFDRDLDWLKPVLELRRTESDEAVLSKKVLLAAVTNEINTELSHFLISFFWLSNQNDRFRQHIASAKELLLKVVYFPNYSDEFLNMLQLHSFNAVMLSSSILNPDYTQNVRNFKSALKYKIHKVATVLSHIVVIGIVVICYFALKRVFTVVSQSTRDWILIFLSLLGFTGIEVLKGQKAIALYIVLLLDKFFQLGKLNDNS